METSPAPNYKSVPYQSNWAHTTIKPISSTTY
jgi:hypothetical protein